ncbi:MAG: radical SAM protein [Euryarchaeota archaeon]|nr:radical SAM protein [Euryarchaeota archaeon]
MISVTRLYLGVETPGDRLRYGRGSGDRPAAKSAGQRRPVVVWNLTRGCNLQCVHCYSDSRAQKYPGELTPEEARGVVDDLAGFGVPALLFSGGEPLLRRDICALARHARSLGLRCTLSTNGTLITPQVARRLKRSGFTYVGISLDSIGEQNDLFRGKKGAYEAALQGIRNCIAAGQKVGLRMTLTRWNAAALPSIFDLIERESIPRACFYHLVYTGRGSQMRVDDLSPRETRRAMDTILERTRDMHRRGHTKDILTVDNPVDGPYLHQRLLREDPRRAREALRLLRWNRGAHHGTGTGIGCIDPQGSVHPDQFWQSRTLGNVRERPFSEIWSDTSNPLLRALRGRRRPRGRCAGCRHWDICGGGFRARAEAATGDPWAPDPACYLTDEEIGAA